MHWSIRNKKNKALVRLREQRIAPNLVEQILSIARRCGSLPDFDSRPADEILGYEMSVAPE